MEDEGYSTNNLPIIKYENGVSSVRVAKAEHPRRAAADHIVKFSSIPRRPPPGPGTVRPSLSIATEPNTDAKQEKTSCDAAIYVINDTPNSGVMNMSLPHIPLKTEVPSTPKKNSIDNGQVLAAAAKIETTIPTINDREGKDVTKETPVLPLGRSPLGNVHAIPGATIRPINVAIKDSNSLKTSEYPQKHNGVADKKDYCDITLVDTNSNITKSSFRKTTNRTLNRQVSFNEAVIVSEEDQSRVTHLQPEDHVYNPCNGGHEATDNMYTKRSCDDLDVDKDRGCRPMAWVVVLVFLLLSVCVALAVLYGISFSRDWPSEITSLTQDLGLTSPDEDANSDWSPFPTSYRVHAAGTSFYLVRPNDVMGAQRPSTDVILTWHRGQKLKIRHHEEDGRAAPAKILGDMLESRMAQYSLRLFSNTTYEGLLAGDQYSLVAITPCASIPVTWTKK